MNRFLHLMDMVIYHLHFNHFHYHFSGKPGLSGPRWFVLPLVPRKRTFGIRGTGFYGPDAIPITPPSQSMKETESTDPSQ